ncbi:hypothetical protein ACTPOE_06985 [Castellaniella sp. WN]
MTLHDERLTSLERLEQFLAGTAGLDPAVCEFQGQGRGHPT